MKSVRKTFKYLVGIVLLAGVVLAGGAGWWWQHSDEVLRKLIVDRFSEIAPGWDVQIGRCRFDYFRTVYMDDITLKVRGESSLIARFPSVRATVDRAALAERQEVIVHKIHLHQPQFNLSRDGNGRWNWQNLPPFPTTNKALPEWEIENATTSIRLERADGGQPMTLVVDPLALQLIPSGKRKFLAKGHATLKPLGQFSLNGRWDVDDKTWTVNTAVEELKVDGSLLTLLSDISPEVGAKLAELRQRLGVQAAGPHDPNSRSPLMLTPTHSAGTVDAAALPELGLEAVVDVDLRLTRWQPDSELEYKLLVGIDRGSIANPLVPYQLHDVAGKVYCDNRELLLRDLSANSGGTQATVNGSFSRKETSTPGNIELKIAGLPLDSRLRSRLSPEFGRIYDMHGPQGQVDVQVSLEYDGVGRWLPRGLLVTAKRCSLLHEKFPYPIEDVQGTARQQGEDIVISMRGMAGRRTVGAEGLIRQPGPAGALVFDIRVDDLPIDESFVNACPPKVKKTLNEMSLRGAADVHLRLTRPAGLAQRTQIDIVANVRNATLEYVDFPYRVERLSGSVSFIDGRWTYSNLKGVHGTAQIQGHGTLATVGDRDRLSLRIDVAGARLDESLKHALTPTLQQQWNAFSPTGTIDVASIVEWTEGRPVVITLPNVDLLDGTMTMTAFPYTFEGIRARFAYTDDLLDIKGFTGAHDGARFRGRGFAQFAADEWRVRLEDVTAENLKPDRNFRTALPQGLGEVISCLDPHAPLNLAGMMEFRGTPNPNDPVTAAWDIETFFSGSTVTIGLEYTDLHGRVDARGTWDGRLADIAGQITLDRASVFGYRFTDIHGPFHVRDNVLVVGSQDALSTVRSVQQKIPLEDHVTAKAIDGVFTIDAAAQLQRVPVYQVKMTMSHAKLETYASLYMPNERNLRGVMNGWVVLQGRGNTAADVAGRGQLQISPAALYELPVVVQMLNALRMAPSDKTAFTYALLDFNIADGKYAFNSIDLVGNTVSMRGRGTAGFDGELSLDFYSMLPRTQLPVPLLSRFVDEATKGWVGVEVRGKINDPVARTKAVPNLDGALKQFLAAFEMGPGGQNAVPPLLLPPLVPPQSRRPSPGQR